ncbi:MAG: hypothetical protein SFV55_29925 [Haliscomenobacter sp.]|uniref:hypothetical protein n=1 Tax=Haliscomenobacter sp. TaxID=2717303 RepID=UPI0029BE22F9|nr:hypothetical protein [Haliscomenobacter sp.]MDX2072691.1 hypothetical protein [Haliscomenobacter sp.]
MGLDLFLVKIEDKEIKETDWLIASENPELEGKFSAFKRTRHFQHSDHEYYDEVYFYSEISYQRKGVTKEFFKKVQNDKCLVNKKDVENLIGLMDKNSRDGFKRDFLDKFVDEQTFLIISW